MFGDRFLLIVFFDVFDGNELILLAIFVHLLFEPSDNVECIFVDISLESSEISFDIRTHLFTSSLLS